MGKWQLVLVLLLIVLYVSIIIVCHRFEHAQINRSPEIVGKSKRKNKAIQRKIWEQQEKKRQQPLKVYMEYHKHHLAKQRKRW